MEARRWITVALAGNANVGKSVIFNQLTGLNQIIGNWPGKTVERAEGTLHFGGHTVRILDLPGIYSLSTFSMEEIVARDYIAIERPDVIVNIVDASALERNLYFTIQLLELQAPVVMALNQMDFAAKKGIEIDVDSLSKILGIPVVPTVAITGVGIKELLSTVIDVVEGKVQLSATKVEYGKEIEENLKKLEHMVQEKLTQLSATYPARWIAIKLLESDKDIVERVRAFESGDEVLAVADEFVSQIERVHGEPSSIVMVSERYGIATRIAREVTRIVSPPKLAFEQRLGAITADRLLGYPILAAVVAAMFGTVFVAGGFFVGILESLFKEMLLPAANILLSQILPPILVEVISGGLLSGIGAGVAIALPYIVPFYVLLAILEDSGYLPRAAYLMDSIMHRIGLHGKAFIPLLLGYGCNVPACVGCRILETDRERFLAGFVVVLVPCAATTVIIMGLVGRFVGLPVALAIYFFDLALVLCLGRLAFKVLPGEPVGLIMEMPPYRRPSLVAIAKKTWTRTRDFVYVAFPLIMIGSVFLQLLMSSGLIWPIVESTAPLMRGWLGLPPLATVPIIFGVLRKELTLILLAELAGTTSFDQVLSPVQMIVFALVTMIYIPCIATIAALAREFGWKRAVGVSIVDISLALTMGGIAYRLLSFMVG